MWVIVNPIQSRKNIRSLLCVLKIWSPKIQQGFLFLGTPLDLYLKDMFIYFWWLRRSFFQAPFFRFMCRTMKTRTLSGPWHGECRSRLPQGKTRWSRLNALWVWSRNQCFFRWFSIGYFPLMIFAWCFHDFFHDFLWFFHHVLWFSMIFLSYPNFIMDITFPHLAGRTSMAQADIGSQETHDVESQWFSYKSHYDFHLNLGWWMIWIFVYRFHMRFHTNPSGFIQIISRFLGEDV